MQSNSGLELIQLENGMIVPALEGRLFCSRRDPVKESEIWFRGQSKLISGAQNILILGLGAGFHLMHFETDRKVFVLELRHELIELFQQRDLPDKPQVEFVTATTELEATVLEFRPAWQGLEKEYSEISSVFRGVTKSRLMEMAEKKDLWILAEALEKSCWPDHVDLSIKEIESLFPIENQTEEAKVWRALRELVV
jgi:hypothetical protein